MKEKSFMNKLLEKFSLSKIFYTKQNDASGHSVIEQSVTDMLNEVDVIENAHEEEKNILKNLIDFGALEASDVMVTRADIISAPIDTSIVKLKELFIKEEISRLPLYKTSIDHIEGFVHVKDMLKASQNISPSQFLPKEYIRNVIFVPESIKLVDLLSKMRSNKSHIAIVLDEHAGTSGLITVEDIVEELVGDIQDEYDQSELQDMITKSANGWIIDASADLDDVEASIEWCFEQNNAREYYSTIGGFIITYLGFIPQTGFEFDLSNNIKIKIIDATNRRVKKIFICKID